MAGVTVVVPTLGRPSLGVLLTALATAEPAPLTVEYLVVDDRADRAAGLVLPPGFDAKVLTGRAAGPAAARNLGWHAARHEWVAFLDDDVVPDPDWLVRLAADLTGAPAHVGGVQGNLRVPLPADRRPTDWERVTAALTDGEWITADMAYRRAALDRTGGFDERLPRAFREDAELAHRVRRAGWALTRGTRTVTHPVRPEGRWVSVRTQRGNADDALLRHLYGRRWRDTLGIPPGRRHRHAALTAAAVAATGCAALAVATGRHRRAAGTGGRGWWTAAAAGTAAVWAAGTAEFAAARIAPGPRDRHEVVTMLATSAVIPPVATAHWLRGWVRWRGARPMFEPLDATYRVPGRPAHADRPLRGAGPDRDDRPTGAGPAPEARR
ncbi:glycosyltransferase family 2 protein [Jidongwangia harbinensis]|uniref:glycosyltransferase family 2 protein n=1 Tax=Jidongwangia harbinensis TaxID=2878561 RepID=UPI001CDA1219|nr:glycosyltransferase [Jidongwangia harbinensis]MCA2211989.1 glycosyltransferase [Jidongwangia harbinensis]